MNFPNQNIYDKYGRLDDSTSKLAKSQYLLIRHGLSSANKFEKELYETAQTKPDPLEYWNTEFWDSKKYPFL